MKLKILFLSLVLLALGGAVHGQAEIPHFASAPATCDPTRGQVYFDTTLKQLQVCTATNTWGGSSSSSLSPSSAYTFSVAAGTVTATPNGTGLSTFSGSDVCVVFNQVTSALALVGGRLFFKNGIYNCNSMTLDNVTGCSSLAGSGAAVAYGMTFPANTVVTSVQWLLEGETAPVWQGEAGSTTVNNAGVIFNVTATAVSSVTAGSVLMGFWQRPITNCTIAASNSSNDVHFKNMSLRFPANTRGNEIAFNVWFAENYEYENVVADFNLPYNTIATGAAPTVGTYGSFGMTTTASSAGNYGYFRNTFSTGYNIAYDFQSEHLIGETVTAIYSNFACEFGRSGTAVFHPIKLIHFVDQENKAGCIWGPQMVQGSRVDIDLDIEFGAANWYARSIGALSETNAGYSIGFITYMAVLQFSGVVAEIPSATLFTSGGGGYTFFEGTANANLSILPGTDTFARPNANSLGPAWVNNQTGLLCNATILSSNVTGAAGGSSCAWVPQASANDQFSKISPTAIGSAVLVTVRGATNALTEYDYGYTVGTGRQLRKRIAGTFTTLAGPTGTAGNGDTFELWVIGTNLYAFYTHLGVTTLDFTASDSSITSGAPGIIITNLDSAINWSGGSLPQFDAQRSLFAPTSFRGTPFKTHVTAADYTNATTTFSNVVGVGQVSLGLGFLVAANTSYTMHCAITWSASAATTGPQFQITGPASPTSVTINMMSAITATTTASAAATAFSSALNPVGATVTSGVNETAFVDMGLVNGANAGTIQLQAAAQGAGTLTIRQGSSCTLQ